MGRKEPQRQYPDRLVLSTGGEAAPWVGMRDAREPTAATADRVLLAQNLFLATGLKGKAYRGRPGIDLLGNTLPQPVQAVETWYRPNGIALTVAVAAGGVYRLDWTSGQWIAAITPAQLATASITLASTGPVALVPFAGGLVFSESAHAPFTWTGADGTGLTALTNVPPLYGKPWVKAAKLMGIRAANRLELLWSEENQPNVGWDAGGYNNAWLLTQLGNAPLTAGIGTNDAIVMFRERACFAIVGDIGPDFRSASTVPDLSSTIGTTSPWSVFASEQGVVFVDSDARPQLVQLGGGIVPLYEDCAETIGPDQVPRVALDRVITLEDRACGVLLMGYPTTTSVGIGKWIAFEIASLNFVAVWTDLDATVAGMLVTDAGEPRWAHVAPDGDVYLHGSPAIGPWSDNYRSAARAIAHVLECAALGRDLTEELAIDTIEVGLSGATASRVTITGETPRGTLTPVEATVAAGSGTRLGAFRLGRDRLASITRDRRVIIGHVGLGRWVRMIFRHAILGENIAFTDARCVVYRDGADPIVP